MKRADRIHPVDKTSRKKHNGSFWLLILCILLLGWYMLQNTKTDPAEKQEKESLIKQDVTSKKVEEPQEPGIAVESIYRIYEGEMDTSEGSYPMNEEIKIFQDGKEMEWENLNSLVGMEEVTLYLDADQEVYRIGIPGSYMVPEKLRIVIASSEGGYYYQEPKISCSQPYWVANGKSVETVEKEEAYIADSTMEEGSRLVLKAAQEDAVWQIEDGYYRGALELVKDKEGWYIVNTVYFEQYLYGVVPSEMPDSYGKEAAKVQAVCSRSFAYTQWRDTTAYAMFGAHMDNTVNCQVYGKARETVNSIEGVEETRGQMLIYEDEVVTSYFFSTSCGVTADAGDVWGNSATQEFPTATPEYLKGKGYSKDLGEESAFHAFITDMEIESYDSESPWYRWSTVISTDGLLDAMMPVIREIHKQRPYLIQTLSDDRFVTQEVEDIGSLKNIYVYSRAHSGLITELLIEGSKGTLLVRGENSIRKVLAAGSIMITLQDGSQRDDQVMLPSAFFSIEKGVDTEGNVLQLTLRGGGYGHGVGMSQNGVKGMLNSGKSWDEILKYYYNGIEIGFVPV